MISRYKFVFSLLKYFTFNVIMSYLNQRNKKYSPVRKGRQGGGRSKLGSFRLHFCGFSLFCLRELSSNNNKTEVDHEEGTNLD